MNHPMSNHQIGQANHREYEAKFGNSCFRDETRQRSANQAGRQKLVLIFTVSSLIIAISYLL